MKATEFNMAIAEAFTQPLKTVTVYARLLKEAGLLTTGARGRNAPEMTPLDAARITIAMLATDSPAKCVERVKRFGCLKHTPQFKKTIRGYDVASKGFLKERFEVDTLESTLAYVFSLPETIGLDKACTWFSDNVFHLRIADFEVLAELFMARYENGERIGEIVIPFQGETMVSTAGGWKHIEEFEPIKGGIRTERMITTSSFLQIGILLAKLDLPANP